MRVVVLGGAGDMGAEAVRDLVKFSDFDMIVIADRDLDAAKRLSESLGDPRVSVEKVDAASEESLLQVMSEKPVVAGALGPFYRFERPIVEAVIKAEADYVSICDDHDAMEAALELDEEAKAKGSKVLCGLGWTPGLSNVLARKGYDELDQVKSIRVFWGASAADSEGMAVILHTLHIFTGMVTSFSGGRQVNVKAGSGKEVIEFPEPLGKVQTFHLGHPEPVTLPRYLEGVEDVHLKGGLAENYLNGLARLVVSLGLTKTAERKQRLAGLLKKVMPLFPADKKRQFSGIRVDVSGIRNGKETTLSYAAVDHMKRLTGIPLSIGAIMMGKGFIERSGVFGPEAEGAVRTDLFIREIERRGIKVEQREL